MIRRFQANLAELWETELRVMFTHIGLVLAGCLMMFLILMTTVLSIDMQTVESWMEEIGIDVGHNEFPRR